MRQKSAKKRLNPVLGVGVLLVSMAMGLMIKNALANAFDDFFKSIALGDVRNVKLLLYRGMDPNLVNEKGQTALTLSILQGQTQIALTLIHAQGIDIDERNAHEETPLMLASLNGDEAVIKALISMDAEINKTGWTPLHYAASKGQIQAMELLLDNSAYIDAASPNQTTPLMMAAGYGSPQSVKLLLDSGADPTLVNDKGLTAMDFAQHANQMTSAQYLHEAEQAWRIKYPKTPNS